MWVKAMEGWESEVIVVGVGAQSNLTAFPSAHAQRTAALAGSVGSDVRKSAQPKLTLKAKLGRPSPR